MDAFFKGLLGALLVLVAVGLFAYVYAVGYQHGALCGAQHAACP